MTTTTYELFSNIDFSDEDFNLWLESEIERQDKEDRIYYNNGQYSICDNCTNDCYNCNRFQ